MDTGTNLMILPYYILNSLLEKLRYFNCVIGSNSQDILGSGNSFIICFDILNIPDISLQFGDYILKIEGAGGKFISYQNNELIWEYKPING